MKQICSSFEFVIGFCRLHVNLIQTLLKVSEQTSLKKTTDQ
ncbi:hypothetical protein XFF6166_1050004 [Xanthomonas citri pv. fuscans]|nr:hypothetical protein XFF6166_1050004 [Xanthomonas citri pv. fuscans]SON98696.1 hypothetical protein XFF6960_1000004 [Xanthomonas citri pv. fuscans]SOO12975.1 hypothetical protein XFF7766_1160008 [Xanthomonas citri pv. fuscans]SOO45626.1 hypothetical protein XFF1815_890007 [Xanthomonas citri pv. fuscans]